MTDNNSDRRKDRLVTIDAWGMWVSVCTLLGLAWMSRSGADIPNIAWVTLGILIKHFGDGLLTAHNYDFGSSAGSRAKDLRPPAGDQEPGKEN